jgi:hypothetical protein
MVETKEFIPKCFLPKLHACERAEESSQIYAWLYNQSLTATQVGYLLNI